MSDTITKLVTCAVFSIGCVCGILGCRDLFIDYMPIGMSIDWLQRASGQPQLHERATGEKS